MICVHPVKAARLHGALSSSSVEAEGGERFFPFSDLQLTYCLHSDDRKSSLQFEASTACFGASLEPLLQTCTAKQDQPSQFCSW